jgi:hypothetical protein
MRTWIAYLLLAFLSCLLCSKQECKADANQNVANHPVNTDIPHIATLPADRGNAKEKQDSSNSQPPQTNWGDIFIKAFVDSWPIIIIGVIGVCVASKTLKALVIQIKEMNRQTVATRMAAEAAQKSVAVIIDKERARTSVTVTEMVTQPEFIVRYEIQFYCPTPALDVQGFVEAFATDNAARMIRRMTPINVSKIVQSNGPINCNVPVNKFANGPTREEFLSGKVSIIFQGSITYRDVFQGPSDAPHKLRFRHKWTGKPSKVQGDPWGYWEIDGKPEENSET